MPPEYRKEMFERVWELRQYVEDNQDNLPKPGTALLHDTLTHAALFFIEVYDQDRRGEPMPESLPDNENLFSLDAYREQLKAS